MKRMLILLVTILLLFWVGTAAAVTLSLEPAFQNVEVGGTASVDLNISGLGDFAPASLGAFSLDLGYDSSILGFDSVSFGPYLGDETLFEADNYFDDSIPGSVYLDSVSFLFDFELDALQPGSFTLATLTFSALQVGWSDLTMDNVVLSDAFGYSFNDVTVNNAAVAPVPEPSTWLLMAMGLVGLIGARRKFVKS